MELAEATVAQTPTPTATAIATGWSMQLAAVALALKGERERAGRQASRQADRQAGSASRVDLQSDLALGRDNQGEHTKEMNSPFLSLPPSPAARPIPRPCFVRRGGD